MEATIYSPERHYGSTIQLSKIEARKYFGGEVVHLDLQGEGYYWVHAKI